MATILSTSGATLLPSEPESPQDEKQGAPDSETDAQEQAQAEPGTEDGALHATDPERDLSDGQRIIATRWKAVSDILGQAFAGCREAVLGSKGEPGLLRTADRREFGRKIMANSVALAEMQREISFVLCGARDHEIGARQVVTPTKSIIIPGQG